MSHSQQRRRLLLRSGPPEAVPYFGKVDYSEGKDADSVRTIYIGRHHMNIRDIPDRFIVNHNAPAAALYYNPAAGRYVVKGRRGEIIHEAKVYGTRSLKIEDSTLLEVEDILRLSMPGILTERLSRPSSDRLTDAIETLQPAQYAVLSRTDSPVLIVQGAAGSGKSIVGLQRISFVLSPHSEVGVLGRPSPDRVIMFGPSRAFLEYVANFLPELDVPEHTADDGQPVDARAVFGPSQSQGR